jgi:hypothetical protein
MRRRITPFLTLAASFLMVAPFARAVQVAGDDGFVHTAAPSDGTPWANVGAVNGASCVYLGSYSTGYWVLTAGHVVSNADGVNVSLNGSSYSAQSGSTVRLTNANNSPTDLVMFRLSVDPGLSNLAINSAGLSSGTSVRMIGNGVGRQANQTYWSVNTGTSPYTWSSLPDSTGANASGYFYSSVYSKTWGDNTVETSGVSVAIPGNLTPDLTQTSTLCFMTDFDAANGQAQAAIGDSGGGVFYKDAQNQWLFAGVMDAVNGYSGQPGSTSVFGNQTYIGDISAYSGQINGYLTAVPEPSTYALMAGGAGLVAIGIRRRRRATKVA